MHIAIITGGNNSEREISLISAQAVKKGLEEIGYTNIGRYDFPNEIDLLMGEHSKNHIDFVFLMIHGKSGEDGQIAGFLDLLNIPYQCTSPHTLSLTINKWHTKLVWRAHSLPVADDFISIPNQEEEKTIEQKIKTKFGFPCVRKELDQGSSTGVHILKNIQDLNKVYTNYTTYDKPILIEEYIEGDEITVAILDQKNGTQTLLPVIHIVPPTSGGFDYTNKYNGKTQEICPSGFSEEIIEQINHIALAAYQSVGCSKYGRIDAILSKKGPILLEINTIPGFTGQSLFPKAAKVAGISFPKLLQHLIDNALIEIIK